MVHFQNAQSLQWATARLTAVKGGGGADNEFVQSAIGLIGRDPFGGCGFGGNCGVFIQLSLFCVVLTWGMIPC